MTTLPDWIENFPGAVTVCDAEGIILYMNNCAAEQFAKDGGRDLIGQNLLDCHPGAAREMLANMLAEQRQHIYTTEKAGQKKLIYQVPWQNADGNYAGLVELGLPLPAEMPHFSRD